MGLRADHAALMERYLAQFGGGPSPPRRPTTDDYVEVYPQSGERVVGPAERDRGDPPPARPGDRRRHARTSPRCGEDRVLARGAARLRRAAAGGSSALFEIHGGAAPPDDRPTSASRSRRPPGGLAGPSGSTRSTRAGLGPAKATAGRSSEPTSTAPSGLRLGDRRSTCVRARRRTPTYRGKLPAVGRALRRSPASQAVDAHYPGGLPEMELDRVAGATERWIVNPAQRPGPGRPAAATCWAGEVLMHYPSGERYFAGDRPALPRAGGSGASATTTSPPSRLPRSGRDLVDRIDPEHRPRLTRRPPASRTFDTPLGTPLRCRGPDEARTSPATDRRDRPRRGTRHAHEVAPARRSSTSLRGRPMLGYVLDAADAATGAPPARRLLAGHRRPSARPFADGADFALQAEPLRHRRRGPRPALAVAARRTSAEVLVVSRRRRRSLEPELLEALLDGHRARPGGRRPRLRRASSTTDPGRSDGSSATRAATVERIVEAKRRDRGGARRSTRSTPGSTRSTRPGCGGGSATCSPSPATGELYLTELVAFAREPTGARSPRVDVDDDGRLLAASTTAPQLGRRRRGDLRERINERAPARRGDDARPLDGLRRRRRRPRAGRRPSSRTSSCAAGRRSGRGHGSAPARSSSTRRSARDCRRSGPASLESSDGRGRRARSGRSAHLRPGTHDRHAAPRSATTPRSRTAGSRPASSSTT